MVNNIGKCIANLTFLVYNDELMLGKKVQESHFFLEPFWVFQSIDSNDFPILSFTSLPPILIEKPYVIFRDSETL